MRRKTHPRSRHCRYRETRRGRVQSPMALLALLIQNLRLNAFLCMGIFFTLTFLRATGPLSGLPVLTVSLAPKRHTGLCGIPYECTPRFGAAAGQHRRYSDTVASAVNASINDETFQTAGTRAKRDELLTRRRF